MNSPPQDELPTIIGFEDGDQENPYNWSTAKKSVIVILGTLVVVNSTVASALPSGDSPQLQQHFNVSDEIQLVLPNSIFLVGYVLGPFFFAPLSENYGRRFIVVGTFLAYTIFTLAICFAPNWAAFIIFRLLTGIFGSTPISVTSGLFADVLNNPVHRGRSVAWFMAIAAFGPALAPTPSGYLSQYSWRWPFWFGLIFAGACAVPIVFLPETFGPAILAKRARKLRRQDPNANVYGALELKKVSPRLFVTTVLGRPLRMIITEPIVSASCLYLSLIYAVFFMLVQVYPIIFEPIYNFNQGETGLAFLAFAVGSLLALPFCFWWDHILFTAKAKARPWSNKAEYQRLPLGIGFVLISPPEARLPLCMVGSIAVPIGLFWFAWTNGPSVHWIVSIIAGAPFGFGLVWDGNSLGRVRVCGLANFLVDSYRIYSASAMGATSISRSIFGVVMPFAARPMYEALGVAWACSLLGFASLLMCLIPYAFIWYGERLRASSPMCQELAKQDSEVSTPVRQDEEKGDIERK
ncbi:hypothetical protein M409DRAFT_69032 [Zasmidium cellare ATCC 36951]|uniref:Major facilitator superfamily (MFS) profile domain-containing protein n=1 Tax=Zasmidium cellare ATCC 36951 TaxID=1080233 RepID=A0A6A6C9S2_ZASCE|nr:uncharacterized protein M409DRAFT_69032 [Zasmidium cellare ATCC 36951]KAF2162399.1 hypothetical protein M409DRAFT_69032 [Zasmidium cellare ATCC 36951]